MGFLNKLKSVNNSWGYVTYLSDGSLGRIFGRIGPKNMIDNRSQELMITSGTMNGPLKDEIVFAAKDVVRATVLQATNEWVKYRLELNSGLVAIVVMTVMGLDVKARGNRAPMDRNFSDKWLNFEAWLGEAFDKGYSITPYIFSEEKHTNVSTNVERDSDSLHKNKPSESFISSKKSSSAEADNEDVKIKSKEEKETEKQHRQKEKQKLDPIVNLEKFQKNEHTQKTDCEDFHEAVKDSMENTEFPEEYCPKCKESLSFMGFEKDEEVECPFCNFKFKLL